MPLITFEGSEGMGKSTQLESLHRYLHSHSIPSIKTFEPGDTAIGAQLRSLLLDVRYSPSDRTELLLYAADRAEHVHAVIQPALDRNAFVLCDRYIDATYAYQGGGRQIPIHLLDQLNTFATQGCMPDLTFLFDGDVEIGLSRARGRALLDRIEKEEASFFNRVRSMYLERARAEPNRFVILDAMQSQSELFDQILEHLRQRFPSLTKKSQ